MQRIKIKQSVQSYYSTLNME